MSAERKLQPQDAPSGEPSPLEPFALKQQVAERLAAHRNRKGHHTAADLAQPTATPARERTARIAAAVAERYAHSKSYRAFLAEEAERAIRQAEAAAEIAALNAQAVAQAQYDLLEELSQYAAEPQSTPALAPTPAEPRQEAIKARPVPATQLDLPPVQQAASLTVRLAEDIRRPEIDPSAIHRSLRTSAREAIDAVADAVEPIDPEETLSLDEEIAFRQHPVFDPVEPTVDIPANLIEFPRQLVAPRKARPRLAEGPLREESEAHPDPSQLRIFEVEAEQISPDLAAESEAPEWSSILLDAQPRGGVEEGLAHYEPAQQSYAEPHIAQHLHRATGSEHLYAAPFQAAPLNLRVMSAAVDACAILAASMIFLAGLVLTASHLSPGGLHMSLTQAALCAFVTVTALSFGYQYLFFTFSDATPGMRYARIGLCSFSDENPTRAAMRKRILALALSTAPLGLGLWWSLLDNDGLAWHDRMSRMYQRSY
ncbi:MAG: RDD family protein [Acidobacteria bacterium]|nr:RDD family protein [Acidobacteriota bacterium]